MPEGQTKVSPASAFLQVGNCLSLASAFRHQGQSGTAGQGVVGHCAAVINSCRKVYFQVTFQKKTFCLAFFEPYLSTAWKEGFIVRQLQVQIRQFTSYLISHG
jgi:hypothetical protein